MFERVAGPDLGPALAAVRAGRAGRGGAGRGVGGLPAAGVVGAGPPGGAGRRGRPPRCRRRPAAAGCSGYEVAEFEVGAALRLSSRAAQARVDGCLAITERPAVLEALRVRPAGLGAGGGGRLGGGRAGGAAGDGAGGRRGGGCRRWSGRRARPRRRSAPRLARLVLKADPAGADTRHQAARRERRVWVSPLEDGMAELRALLTAPDAHARVRRARGGRLGGPLRPARRSAGWRRRGPRERGEPPVDPGPLPTLDQCRADALVDCYAGVRRAGSAGQAGGGRVPPGLGWLLAPEGPAPRQPRGDLGERPAAASGSARRSWSPSPPGPCSAWAGSPPTSPGTARSPTPWPASSPRTAPGGGC